MLKFGRKFAQKVYSDIFPDLKLDSSCCFGANLVGYEEGSK